MTTAKESVAGAPDVQSSRPPGYLSVLRTRGMPAWFTVAVCQRLPIAMAPLALVLLGRDVTGSFSVGAALAGVFALAEAAAASVMGRRFDVRPAAPELRLVLGVQGMALLLTVVVSQVFTGATVVVLMAVLAAIAGAIAAGAHGGLRALVVRSVPADVQHQALGLETTMTALMWAIGPALVAALAVIGGAPATLIAPAVIALAGVVTAGALLDPGRAETPEQPESVWRRSWPAMMHEASVLLMVGAAFTALPALLDTLGADPDLSGLALGGFAVAGITGGIIYGARRWAAPYRVQTMVLILALCAFIGAGALTGSVALVVAFLLLGGLSSTPALTARGAGLQELLPESQWSAGFSNLYAAGGIGFGLAGMLVAPLLAVVGPDVALTSCAVLAAALALVGTAAEKRGVARVAEAVPATATT
jgi:hypothetical protein